MDNDTKGKLSEDADADAGGGMPGTLTAVTACLEPESVSRPPFHEDLEEGETAEYLPDIDDSLYRDVRSDATKRGREALLLGGGQEESGSNKIDCNPSYAREETHQSDREYAFPPNAGGDAVAVRLMHAEADIPPGWENPESGSKKRTSRNKTVVDSFPTSGSGNTHLLQEQSTPNEAPAFAQSSSSMLTSQSFRRRAGLPIIIQGKSGPSGPVSITVTACPDTGTDMNIISLDMITRLGLLDDIVRARPGDEQKFRLPNQTTVKAVGSVATKVLFGNSGNRGLSSDSAPVLVPIKCQFYIFNSLIVDVVMGRHFLDKTETLTKHPERLVEELVPAVEYPVANSTVLERHGSSQSGWSGILSHFLSTLLFMLQGWLISCLSFPLKIRCIFCRLRSTPVNSLYVVCRLDSHIGQASADTGSDINLVSSNFAISKGFQVLPVCHELQFADGSTGSTIGSVKVKFSVGFMDEMNVFIERGDPVDLEFHVFDQLSVDILVGQDTLRSLKIFEQNSELLTSMDALLPSPPGISSLGSIRTVGPLEQEVKEGWGGLKKFFTKIACKISSSRASSPSLDTSNMPEHEGPLGVDAQRENAQLEEARREEKARRERAQLQGTSTSPPQQPGADNVGLSTQQATDDNVISASLELL